jgi:hypothetical protein
MFNFLLQSTTLVGAKNAISAVLIGAITTISNPGTAVKPTSFDASVYVSANSKIKVAVQKSVPGSVWVTLSDSRDHILSQTTLGKKDMKTAMQFDVSELPDGAYTLTIKSREGSIVKQVNLGTPKPARTIEMQ